MVPHTFGNIFGDTDVDCDSEAFGCALDDVDVVLVVSCHLALFPELRVQDLLDGVQVACERLKA